MEGSPEKHEEQAAPANQAGRESNSGPSGPSPYTTDFYIYSFKVVPCSATYAHNWSLCPFVHPNEKARRRDPRLHVYEPLPCPFDKKGANCPHGDSCQYTHNVYEYWLHPKRFRTQMCQQGSACKRHLCFFAHNLQELRFADGQLQRAGVQPAASDLSAALAAAAAAGAPQAGLMPLLADTRQQQAVAAAAPLGAGGYVPALVPYALMSAGMGPGSLQSLPSAGTMLPAGLAGTGAVQARAFGAPLQAPYRDLQQQQQQQQAWVSGYLMPQGYVMLPGAGQSPMVSPVAAPLVQGTDLAQLGQLQQQQQYYPAVDGLWQQQAAAGGAAAAAAAVRPMADAAALSALQLDASGLMSNQYQVVPDDHVLLGQPAGVPGADSSSSFIAVQPQQQQQQQDSGAVPVSGSGYSWSLNPVAPSTTSASVSMSVLSLPTAAHSSASVPGSSNNSLTHMKAGQVPAGLPMDVLQATMQQMSVKDCHVRDL